MQVFDVCLDYFTMDRRRYYVVYCGKKDYISADYRLNIYHNEEDGYFLYDLIRKIEDMHEIYQRARKAGKDIIVVCDEKDRSVCVRQIVAEMIANIERVLDDDIDEFFNEFIRGDEYKIQARKVCNYSIQWHGDWGVLVVKEGDNLDFVLWRNDGRWRAVYLKDGMDGILEFMVCLMANWSGWRR